MVKISGSHESDVPVSGNGHLSQAEPQAFPTRLQQQICLVIFWASGWLHEPGEMER